STRQRFVAVELDIAPPEQEAVIVTRESGVDAATARALVELAGRLRNLRDRGLAEIPSTRLLVAAAQLIAGGIDVRTACNVAIVEPLSDDPTLLAVMRELVHAMFP